MESVADPVVRKRLESQIALYRKPWIAKREAREAAAERRGELLWRFVTLDPARNDLKIEPGVAPLEDLQDVPNRGSGW